MLLLQLIVLHCCTVVFSALTDIVCSVKDARLAETWCSGLIIPNMSHSFHKDLEPERKKLVLSHIVIQLFCWPSVFYSCLYLFSLGFNRM